MVRPFEVAPVARRAASFGGQVGAYAAERPDHPDAAIRWVLAPGRGRSSLTSPAPGGRAQARLDLTPYFPVMEQEIFPHSPAPIPRVFAAVEALETSPSGHAGQVPPGRLALAARRHLQRRTAAPFRTHAHVLPLTV